MRHLYWLLVLIFSFGTLRAESEGPRQSTSPSSAAPSSAEGADKSGSAVAKQERKKKKTIRQAKSIMERWYDSTIGLAIRYGLFAGVAWLFGYVFFKKRWLRRKIVPHYPSAPSVRREIWYSARTVIIFGLVGALTAFAAKQGWTQMYFKFTDHGQAWFVISIILGILLHDTYFYWTHRLMHHRRLFKLFHRGHHLSTNPTPWAAYAFDPLEAVVQGLIFPIIVFAFPIHPAAFGIIMLWQITFNIAGHMGYEFNPRWMMDTWLGKILNTPTNHAMHHESMRGNYGLYFNIWDRLMGTNHKDYEDRFREVTHRQ